MGFLNFIAHHYPGYIQRLGLALLLIFFSVIIGVIGFIVIEDLQWFEAFYMTVITISTVGYGELYPLSNVGRVFVSFYIITNIGIFTYAISTIASLLIEGKFREAFKIRKKMMKIESLEQHTIVCGYGRNGREACAILEDHKIPFVVIENNKDRLEVLKKKENFYCIEGSAIIDENLIKSGILKAKAIITTLQDDSDNLFIVLSARNLNKDIMIISPASNDSNEKKLKIAGANHIIIPEKIGGSYMAKTIVSPDAIEIFKKLSSSAEDELIIEEIALKSLHNKIPIKTVLQFDFRKITGINIIGLKNKEGKYIINPQTTTETDEYCVIITLGTKAQFENFHTFLESHAAEKK